jgi:hypothetical protein
MSQNYIAGVSGGKRPQTLQGQLNWVSDFGRVFVIASPNDRQVVDEMVGFPNGPRTVGGGIHAGRENVGGRYHTGTNRCFRTPRSYG